jgi:hypothetical protein
MAVAGKGILPPWSEFTALQSSLTGNNIEITQEINDDTGGTISDKLGEIALEVPIGAFSHNVEITVKKNNSGQEDAKDKKTPPVPVNYRQVSPLYTLGPSEAYFAKPATLILKVAIPPVVRPENLALARYNPASEKWISIPAVVDTAKGLIVARVRHFSDYAVLARQERNAFDDVTPADWGWAQDSIELLAGAGVVRGVDTASFDPGRAITRAELVSILAKALNLPAATANPSFNDVEDGEWFTDSIAAAVQTGLVKGYEDGSFHPNNTITREELATIMVRALSINISSDEKHPFTDTGKISAWAKDSIATAVSANLVKGYPDGTFRPEGSATRAECAAVIYRALANF